jgi:Uma2 family endonuclease
MAVQVGKRLFTVDEYHKMAEAGILKEDDRVELLGGEIILMSPIGEHHAGVVNRLNALLNRLLLGSAIIAVQNPISLTDDSEPEPDIAVLRFRDDYYTGSIPTSQDIIFLIEVSDTTDTLDRSVKVPRYAQAGIQEVWIANLQDRMVEVYSSPHAGIYQKVRRAQPGESLPLAGFPEIIVRVEDVLP